MTTILVPPEQIAHVDRASLRADLDKAAADHLNQAGQGLIAAFEQCKIGSSDGHTLYVLIIVLGYITDAMAKLVEKEHLGIEVAV